MQTKYLDIFNILGVVRYKSLQKWLPKNDLLNNNFFEIFSIGRFFFHPPQTSGSLFSDRVLWKWTNFFLSENLVHAPPDDEPDFWKTEIGGFYQPVIAGNFYLH